METAAAALPITYTDDGQPGREARGKQIAASGQIKRVGSRFAVPSQSGASGYFVDLIEQTCTCPDHLLRGHGPHALRCKHQEAVLYSIAWGSDVDVDGAVTETVTVKRKKYPRDWSSYNEGQVHEREYVERLLRALCDGIPQPPRKPGRGRKPIPLKDAAFAAVMKVYGGMSQRRAQTDLRECAARGRLDRVGHFNAISAFLDNEASTAILLALIEESAKPLAAIERGQFAIDSTGISTVTYDRWFDQKHGKLHSAHPWVKLHLMVGTVTHVVTGVKVSPEGDCPQLPELLKQTMRHFKVNEVSADLAYSSKDNLEVCEKFGVEPFIPFKSNAVIDEKNETWSRHLCEFLFNLNTFLPHYHRRSNVETVMWMLKSKFGGAVRSKLPVAQVNETLAKVLCHNLACLVHAIFTAGLAPRFWQDAPMALPPPKLTLVPPAPDQIDPLTLPAVAGAVR